MELDEAAGATLGDESRWRKFSAVVSSGEGDALLEIVVRFGFFVLNFAAATILFLATFVSAAWLGMYGAEPLLVAILAIVSAVSVTCAMGEWLAYVRRSYNMQEWLGVAYGCLGGLLLIANVTCLTAIVEGVGLTSDLAPPCIAWTSFPVIVYLLICGVYYILRDRPKAGPPEREQETLADATPRGDEAL